MKLHLLTVATDPYPDNTAKLVSSLQEYEPDCPYLIIDNACAPAYTDPHASRLDKRVSFARALNLAADMIRTGWMVMLSNDTLATDPFIDFVNTLDPKAIYGKDMNKGYGNRTWLDGWIYVMTKKTFDKVGGFDEHFKAAGFEDADFCWRAQAAGVEVELEPRLPFIHTRKHTRYGEPGFFEKRKDNILYLERKYGLK